MNITEFIFFVVLAIFAIFSIIITDKQSFP